MESEPLSGASGIAFFSFVFATTLKSVSSSSLVFLSFDLLEIIEGLFSFSLSLSLSRFSVAESLYA